MTATIRRLVPDDAPHYRTLMLEAYERHPDAFTSTVSERGSLPLSWWETRLQAEAQPPDMVLGAFQGSRMVGVAGVSFDGREKSRHKAYLFGMYVPSESRKAGVGKALVLAVLEHAQRRPGVKIVQLTVTQGNDAALGLYERCGFVPFGIEPFAIAVGPDFVSKVHMWCNLRAG